MATLKARWFVCDIVIDDEPGKPGVKCRNSTLTRYVTNQAGNITHKYRRVQTSIAYNRDFSKCLTRVVGTPAAVSAFDPADYIVELKDEAEFDTYVQKKENSYAKKRFRDQPTEKAVKKP